jgi:hypothetical protein
MGRSEVEIKGAIEQARDWFYGEYGEELSATELAKYFSDRYESEKVAALRNRFESFRGPDLAIACAVCVNLASAPCRAPKRTNSQSPVQRGRR